MKLKITAEINIDNFIIDKTSQEELDCLISILNDKEETFLILHSNDIGDSIGSTNQFNFEIIK
jgi:hypothetical protein